MFPLKLDI